MKLYGESGRTAHYLIEGVISFNNASPAVFAGNAAGFGPNFREPALFVGTTTLSMDDITVQQCYTFDPADTVGGGADVGYTSLHNTNGLWQNNYFLNGYRGVRMTQWDSLIFRNNFVYSARTTGARDNDSLIDLQRQGNPRTAYDLNHNTYFDSTAVETTCPSGGPRRIPFYDDGSSSDCNGAMGGPLDWNGSAGWSSIGGSVWESGSTYTAGAPTSNVIAVRTNAYDPGRANIVIMNWAHSSTVNLDLSSVLKAGDSYSIYAAETYLGAPVVSGTYNGGPVS